MDAELNIFEIARETGWMPVLLYLAFKDKLADLFKRETDPMQTLNSRVAAVERIAVSEERVREIVRNEMKPLLDSQHEIKTSLKDITEIVTEIRIEQARAKGREDRQ